MRVVLLRLRKQFALTVQVRSPTVWVMPPLHVAGGPACDAGAPQSESAKRIEALMSLIGRVNVMATTSPV